MPVIATKRFFRVIIILCYILAALLNKSRYSQTRNRFFSNCYIVLPTELKNKTTSNAQKMLYLKTYITNVTSILRIMANTVNYNRIILYDLVREQQMLCVHSSL